MINLTSFEEILDSKESYYVHGFSYWNGTYKGEDVVFFGNANQSHCYKQFPSFAEAFTHQNFLYSIGELELAEENWTECLSYLDKDSDDYKIDEDYDIEENE